MSPAFAHGLRETRVRGQSAGPETGIRERERNRGKPRETSGGRQRQQREPGELLSVAGDSGIVVGSLVVPDPSPFVSLCLCE